MLAAIRAVCQLVKLTKSGIFFLILGHKLEAPQICYRKFQILLVVQHGEIPSLLIALAACYAAAVGLLKSRAYNC